MLGQAVVVRTVVVGTSFQGALAKTIFPDSLPTRATRGMQILSLTAARHLSRPWPRPTRAIPLRGKAARCCDHLSADAMKRVTQCEQTKLSATWQTTSWISGPAWWGHWATAYKMRSQRAAWLGSFLG